MMSSEAWIMITGLAIANLFTLVGGLVHMATRLTKIETDLKWIKKRCPQCLPSLDNLLP
jgi:hypothetical protein